MTRASSDAKCCCLCSSVFFSLFVFKTFRVELIWASFRKVSVAMKLIQRPRDYVTRLESRHKSFILRTHNRLHYIIERSTCHYFLERNQIDAFAIVFQSENNSNQFRRLNVHAFVGVYVWVFVGVCVCLKSLKRHEDVARCFQHDRMTGANEIDASHFQQRMNFPNRKIFPISAAKWKSINHLRVFRHSVVCQFSNRQWQQQPQQERELTKSHYRNEQSSISFRWFFFRTHTQIGWWLLSRFRFIINSFVVVSMMLDAIRIVSIKIDMIETTARSKINEIFQWFICWLRSFETSHMPRIANVWAINLANCFAQISKLKL